MINIFTISKALNKYSFLRGFIVPTVKIDDNEVFNIFDNTEAPAGISFIIDTVHALKNSSGCVQCYILKSDDGMSGKVSAIELELIVLKANDWLELNEYDIEQRKKMYYSEDN